MHGIAVLIRMVYLELPSSSKCLGVIHSLDIDSAATIIGFTKTIHKAHPAAEGIRLCLVKQSHQFIIRHSLTTLNLIDSSMKRKLYSLQSLYASARFGADIQGVPVTLSTTSQVTLQPY